MDRSDLDLVLAIRRHGSLSAAARDLDVAPPAITKRLAAIEGRLGHRLFDRSTRRVTPTAEGELVCTHAGQLVQQFERLDEALAERRSGISGTVRLAATLGFGRRWLGPALAEFRQLHPQVRFELRLTEQLPDLVAEGLDGAVWLWQARGAGAAQWTTRRLARNRRIVVAAPAYASARGLPSTPAELAEHDCLTVHENQHNGSPGVGLWSLQHDKESVRVRVQGPLAANSGELVRDWCLAGQGLMLRSEWDVAPLLAEGRLVQALPGWAMLDADVHWLAPWQPRTPRRIRVLADFLAERFRGEPWQAPVSAARARPAPRRSQ